MATSCWDWAHWAWRCRRCQTATAPGHSPGDRARTLWTQGPHAPAEPPKNRAGAAWGGAPTEPQSCPSPHPPPPLAMPTAAPTHRGRGPEAGALPGQRVGHRLRLPQGGRSAERKTDWPQPPRLTARLGAGDQRLPHQTEVLGSFSWGGGAEGRVREASRALQAPSQCRPALGSLLFGTSGSSARRELEVWLGGRQPSWT